jgi:hypothetical protein
MNVMLQTQAAKSEEESEVEYNSSPPLREVVS